MKIIILIFFTLVACHLNAQIDSHYWTHQYGAKGLLLNGAVIASSEDETNIFYNPGAIGQDDNLGFAFSFLSPTYAKLQANNFLGDNTSLTDSGHDFSPGFAAVRWQPFKNKKLTLGIASFERFKSDINFENRITDQVNETGFFVLRADIDLKRRISEDWFGVGLSYNITDNFGFGVSQFSAWHSQRLDVKLIKEIFTTINPQSVVASWRSDFSYNISTYSGWVTKLGMSYKISSLRLGATFTTPTYGILKSGASYRLDDQRTIKEENFNDVISNRNDTDLTNYRTPWSIGFGAEYLLGNVVVSFSCEYFSKIDEYTVFSEVDDSFNGSTTADADVVVNVKSKNLSVFNFAGGIQIKKSDRVTLLGGFRTDFNQDNSLLLNDSAEYLGSAPNIFHISGGAMFDYGKNVFSIGVDLGYGARSGAPQLADFTDVNVDNLFSFSGKNNVSNSFYSVMLFITYDFIFASRGE
jgi:hypothetical protein